MTALIKVGKWHYNDQSGELFYDDQTVRLPNQQHALLSLLISNGQNGLTSREHIIATLWPQGRVVEYDQSLNACMRKLRLALEDDSQNPQYIETIPGKGYRFVADIAEITKPRFKTLYAVAGVGFFCFIGMLFLLLKGEQKDNIDVPILAVMPVLYLQSGNEDSKSHPSAVALREELLAQLSRTPTQELIVLAPSSVDKLEESQQIDQASIYQLIGTMRQDPLNFRIDIRLTNHLQQQLWSESFVHTNGAGMPAFQVMARDIISGVANVLDVSTVSVATPQVALAPSDLVIYNDALYLASEFSKERGQKAIEKFKRVIAAYPRYVPAIVQLAKLYNTLASNSTQGQSENFALAAQYARQAIEYDANSAEAYFVLAYVQLYHDWQFAEARVSLDKGLSISPNNGFARSLNAAWHASQSQMMESMKEASLARRLDPLSQTVNADLCWYLNFAEQFAKAETECASILDVEPQSTWTHLGLIEALMQQQKVSFAVKQYAQLFNIPKLPDDDDEKAIIDNILQQWLTQMLSAYEQGQVQAYPIAALYSQLNDAERAMQWLQKAHDDRNGFIVFTHVDPRFNTLHGSPEFQNLLKKLYEGPQTL